MTEPASVAERQKRWEAVLKAQTRLLQEQAEIAAEEAKKAAAAKTRATEDRGTHDNGLTNRLFQKPQEPKRIPNRLDKLKRLLTPTPPRDNEEQRKLDALKAIEDMRKNSSGGTSDPSRKHTLDAPGIHF